MVPTREIFWNVGNLQTTVYIVALVAMAIAAFGIVQHYRRWHLGTKEARFDHIGERLKYLFKFIIGHGQILREFYPGVMHLLIFWGFFILFLGTLTIAFQEDFLFPLFGKKILFGNFYLIYSLMLDLFGSLAIVGIIMALYRRYVIKPRKLDSKPSDLILLCLILFILITGFLVEGLRISTSQPPWALWEPGGWLFGRILNLLALEKTVQVNLHKTFWWIHLIGSMGLIAYFPFSNLFHVVSSSLNVFFRSLKPRGALFPIDFSKGQPLGVEHIPDFTWKHLLDLDACTRCGRCQENCPAYLSEKPLNPKKVILDLKHSLYKYSTNYRYPPLAGHTISEDELWACTTCYACIEACPVFVEHVEKIINLRRNSVMEGAKFPSEVKKVFRDLETYGDTYGRGASYRADWAFGLPVKRIKEDSNFDILLWAGCEGSFNNRNREVLKLIVKILQEAGVSVGILGKEERCCGDPARRIGNEYLFQELVQENIDSFNRYGIKKIITHCPHCFNTLKNEYALFGSTMEIFHYSEYILDLLRLGRLKVKRSVEAIATFQDPCYLGRVNGIYEAPREILKLIPGVQLKEMVRSKGRSFCCGGGGGRMWMHEHLGRRINQMRTREALETGVNLIVTGCPYCLTMFEDGLRGQELEWIMKTQDLILDLAEILYRSIE